MGSISTGVGLISGIDISSLIESLITLESRPKFRLQEQVTSLQAQQSALLDVNARLLNFKNAASAFRTANIFTTALATSTDPETLTASATQSAQPGSYQFIVRNLVQTSQQLSGGYATTDAHPLGLDQMSFEFGFGSLSVDRAVEELNGGDGIDRGRITINDRSGATAEIDLTDVVRIGEVVERINAASGISVTASIEDDHLVLSDSSGGGGTLSVTSASGDTTAADLGIEQDVASNTLTGSSVFYLGLNTALSTLNDGNGVLIVDGTHDIRIRDSENTSHDIDFGRIDVDINDATLLSELNDGAGIRFDDDPDTADIAFVDRAGTTHEVDLSGITTVGGLRTRISAGTGGLVELTVHPDGDKFTITNFAPGSGPLKVLGAGDTDTDAAEDLGILEEDGVVAGSFTGEIVPSTIDQSRAVTVGDVIDRINEWDTNVGKVVASIHPDGKRLRITDTAGGTNSLKVFDTGGNDSAAYDLGIRTNGSGTQMNGLRIIGGMTSVMADSINGGAGLGGATSISITDRNGMSLTLNNLDTYDTLEEIITAINDQAAALTVGVTVGLNDVGNGLKVTDTSGGTGNLLVTGDAATALGIDANVAADTVDSGSLQLQYVSRATLLSDLNYGRGIGTGSFTITDGLGDTATVTIGGDEETLEDVIAEINSRGLAVTARINDNGDGLIIEEDPVALAGETPFVPIRIVASGGSAAKDLNIIGESDDVVGGFIDGSYERVVDLDTSDSLDDVVSKINDAGIGVSATVVNTGSGSKPYRLNLTSGIAGRAGEMVIDTQGVDIGLSKLSRGQDARIFFGASTPEDGFLLTSDSNTFAGVATGLTIDVHAVSDDPVTVTVERDVQGIVDAMSQFATTFNDAIGRINDYDFYDVETETRGVLLGDPTVATVRSALYRVSSGRALNVDGPLQFLSQVGFGFNSNGEMTFDQEKFNEVYASDPEAVEALMATYDITNGSTTTVTEGVTVSNDDTVYNALGFANLFDRLLDDLTNSVDGTVTRADRSFDDRLALLNDRIADMDERLAAKRDQLLREFTAMETTLANLQTQSQSLLSLQTNLASIQV